MNTKEQKIFFTALYNSYSRYITSLIYRKTSDIHLSEELTHDVFVKIMENRAIFRIPPCLQKKYLHKCAKNRLVDHYRSMSRLPPCDTVSDTSFIPYMGGKALESCYIEGEILMTLHDTLLRKINSEEQYVIRKKFFDNERTTAICRKSQISRYRFRRILRKATEKVKEELAPYF
ncbi:MAG: sigma-70 family RNA polymerase sigma factor [Spirochaetes bacterium]|jgi:RNA polymerase sigma factor (sigma-70 family)|nr:sigma-70 family RNA polymerase sigma factor [Spirochaetota bacterium]